MWPLFRLDPARVPRTGFTNFGPVISFSNIATISGWKLWDTTTLERPPADVFAPSHGWQELVNDPVPAPKSRFERDFFVNTEHAVRRGSSSCSCGRSPGRPARASLLTL